MLKANWTCLVNMALLVGYFVSRESRTAWPEPLIVFGWIFPINYQGHLKRIQKHLAISGPPSATPSEDVDLEGVADVINRAIEKQRNPQAWWASFYH